jgi:hypothetical protein
MDCELRVVVTYVDDDPLLGVDFVAASSRYSGSAALWLYPDSLRELATAIQGFPASIPDSRSGSLGSQDIGYAGGYVSLVFRTVDGAGHAVVDVEIRDDGEVHSPAEARFVVPVTAAGVDEFVRGLRSVADRQNDEAYLAAAPG